MNLSIRPTPPDHPQVRNLIAVLDAYLAELYEPEANHILDLQALQSADVEFLGAWSGDTLAGCGAARRMPAEDATQGRPYGEIKRMVVVPELRGQGVATRLLARLESGLAQCGLDRALLETGRAQAEAVALYTRAGYVPRPAFGGYPDNGLSLFMEKRWSMS